MKEKVFSQKRLYKFLVELEMPTGITLYMRPDSFPRYLQELSLPEHYDELKEAAYSESVVRKAKAYETGAAIFWNGQKHIVLPPFPIKENKVLAGYDPSSLREIFEEKHRIGVVSVRLDEYGVGVFDGKELVASKVGTGHIHPKHRKGGRSAKRFTRRTEEQKKNFLRRIENRVEEIFKPYEPDYIFFGGNKLILDRLRKECDYLERNAHKISERILNPREIKMKSLWESLEEIEKSVVFSY